jgi:hypothetical protein
MISSYGFFRQFCAVIVSGNAGDRNDWALGGHANRRDAVKPPCRLRPARAHL